MVICGEIYGLKLGKLMIYGDFWWFVYMVLMMINGEIT